MVLFSRALPEATYGSYQSFWVYLYLFGALAGVGIQVATLSYSAASLAYIIRSISYRYRLLYAAFITIITLAFALFQQYQTQIAWLPAGLFFGLYVISMITESVLLIFKEFRSLLIVNLLYSIAFVVIHVVAVLQSHSLSTLFSALTVLVALKTMLVARTFIIALRRIESSSTLSMRSVQKHWLHMYLYDLSQFLFKYIDKFILSLFLTKALFAVYFNGSIDIPFLPILLGAVSSAALIHISDNNRQSQERDIQTVLYASRILTGIVFPLFAWLLFFRHELFDVVFTEKYRAAVPVFMFAIGVIPLRCYGFTTMLQKRQKGNIINLGAFLDLFLAVVLMYPMYRLIGLPGVAFSFVISTYLQAAFYLYYTAKMVGRSMLSLIPAFYWVKIMLASIAIIGGMYYGLQQTSLKSNFILLLGMLATMTLSGVLLFFSLRRHHTSK